MNKNRIEELAEQAAEYCKTQPREIAGTMWERKFAELIIEECMKIVHEQYEDLVEDMKINPEKWTPKEYWKGYISCGVDSYVAIRQHFYPIEE
jgi:hypothetical protein